jgi:protein TonB
VKTVERAVPRVPERSVSPRTTAAAPRTYGAPISEPPRAPSIALNSPINSSPTTSNGRSDNNFAGRTVEASDTSGRTSVPQPSAAAPVVVAPPAPVDVTPAKIVKRVTPVVSGAARKVSGFVVVRFDITDDGRVGTVEVVESTPPGVFDDAATTAVRKWVYEPRKENGVPVASQAKARLVFEMAN